MREAQTPRQLHEPSIQVRLAPIASGGRIANKLGIAQLVRVVDHVADTDVPAKLTRQVELQRGECRRDGGHGEGAVSEGVMRELNNQRTVDAAREGDEGRAEPGDNL